MININVNDIFFKSYSTDPNSGHSVYVFDSTYLPSPEEIGNKQVYDLLINELMDRLIATLPSAPYSLVVFSSGFSKKKISWVYGIKMYSKLPNEARMHLQKTYIVHESFFIRSVYQVLSNAMSIKFLGSDYSSTSEENKSSIVHVPNLTALASLIDITRLRISLNVYLHDYEFCERIELPQEYFHRLTPLGKRQYRQLIFDKIFKHLRKDATKNELVFTRPGSYKKVNILLQIIERNNYIDLSQWDIYSLGSVFLNFIKNKSKPMVPIDMIKLPINDDLQYTYDTFVEIIGYNQYQELFLAITPLFLSIIDSQEVTKHDYKSISKALTPTFCKENVSMNNSDRLSVGTRFVKNFLQHFSEIKERLSIERVGRNTKPMAPPELPKPRKLSPTKYDSRNNSPTRTAPPLPERKPSTEFPVLRPASVSVRINSDASSNAVSEEDSSVSAPALSPFKPSVSLPDSITEMVTDENNDVNKLIFHANKLTLDNNSKIQTFDKELRRKKILNEKNVSTSTSKFSNGGYSDIKSANKVSKLAALYEERLQGLKVMKEIELGRRN